MKVAFDENIPIAMVKVFQAFASERQMRALSGGLQIESAEDYTPQRSDADYVKGSDEPWVRRFARAGGRVVISGNTSMMDVPHERLALVQEGMVVIFFGTEWNGLKFCSKCAFLLHWWPVVVATAKTAQPPSFWHVPGKWELEDKLHSIPTEDQKLLRIERQIAEGPRRSRQNADAGTKCLRPRMVRPRSISATRM